MRVLLVVRLALGLVLASTRALAQDADALRRELEQLRQQLKTSPPWPASRWGGRLATRLSVGWIFGTVVSVIGMGASAWRDLPPEPPWRARSASPS